MQNPCKKVTEKEFKDKAFRAMADLSSPASALLKNSNVFSVCVLKEIEKNLSSARFSLFYQQYYYKKAFEMARILSTQNPDAQHGIDKERIANALIKLVGRYDFNQNEMSKLLNGLTSLQDLLVDRVLFCAKQEIKKAQFSLRPGYFYKRANNFIDLANLLLKKACEEKSSKSILETQKKAISFTGVVNMLLKARPRFDGDKIPPWCHWLEFLEPSRLDEDVKSYIKDSLEPILFDRMCYDLNFLENLSVVLKSKYNLPYDVRNRRRTELLICEDETFLDACKNLGFAIDPLYKSGSAASEVVVYLPKYWQWEVETGEKNSGLSGFVCGKIIDKKGNIQMLLYGEYEIDDDGNKISEGLKFSVDKQIISEVLKDYEK